MREITNSTIKPAEIVNKTNILCAKIITTTYVLILQKFFYESFVSLRRNKTDYCLKHNDLLFS